MALETMTIAAFVNANSMRIPLADKSVHMAVTSPPYWALRDYGTAQWEGGSAECDHKRGKAELSSAGKHRGGGGLYANTNHAEEPYQSVCAKCGAIRIDNQLGLEKLHDCLGWATGAPCGECFVCYVIAWAREVKRVLRDDGTFWMNIGDSYAGSHGTTIINEDVWASDRRIFRTGTNRNPPGLKPKDMCLIPARVALALQADGWYVRSDIIWAKPNPMPESCKDRPTKSHEYLWLLTKSARYYWDAEAVREPNKEYKIPEDGINGGITELMEMNPNKHQRINQRGRIAHAALLNPAGRNIRSVWQIATHPYSGAHFATYPPALVEPCIKAGTSERGCCPSCGKQWVRVVETSPMKIRRSSNYPPELRTRTSGTMLEPATSTTLGWRPDCDHYGLEIIEDQPSKGRDELEAEFQDRLTAWYVRWYALKPLYDAQDTKPAAVLDPFSGAATTGLVCQQLGRRHVGLDLSLDYIKMGRERCGIDALEAWKGNGKAHEADLSDLPMFSPTPLPAPLLRNSPTHGAHGSAR